MNYKQLILSLFVACACFFQSYAQDGKQLFKEKTCNTCHSAGTERLIGPGLRGVTARRDTAWLREWIRNSQEMIAKGDSAAVAIFNEYNKTVMPPVDITDAEIDAILAYVESPEPEPSTTASEGEKPSTAEQTKEWTNSSEGFTAVTIIPLIMLAVLFVVIWLAGKKVPGLD